MLLTLYHDKPTSIALAASFLEGRVLSKLQALDHSARKKGVAALSPGRNPLIDIGMEISSAGKVTKNGYGVFHLAWLAQQHPAWADAVALEAATLRDGIRQAHKQPLKFVIWAGMGGSAEDKSMYNAAGLFSKGPRVYVLDSTDPVKRNAILDDIAKRSGKSLAKGLKSTLVVGMAMGMTSYEPVVNLEHLAALYDKHAIDSQANFVYMTLPASLLDKFAKPRGYRRIELQLDGGNTTAGRHSAPLTRGSLLPLALAGVDLDAWMRGTNLDDQQIHTAWQLASFLQTNALEGRDKVTLLPSASLAPAALWTKQDFEESLGKSEDLGIKIVIGEKVKMANYHAPKDPAQDRVFLIVQHQGEKHPDKDKLALIRRAGYPAAILALPKDAPLSTYLQFIHYVVFGLAWLRRVNFVTQPGVELYKAITSPLYDSVKQAGAIEKTPAWQAWRNTPEQARWRGGLTLYYDRLPDPLVVEGADAVTVYATALRRLVDAHAVEYGELTFFGDIRYSPRGQAMKKSLDRAAGLVFRARLKMPADVYEGPAMNHSYHEMIIGHGRCFTTILLSEKTADPAPYHRAQFLATQTALAERGRAVVSITLKDLSEPSLRSLDEFFTAVAAQLGARHA